MLIDIVCPPARKVLLQIGSSKRYPAIALINTWMPQSTSQTGRRDEFICSHSSTNLNSYLPPARMPAQRICGYRIVAITPAFQVGEGGSIPPTRSNKIHSCSGVYFVVRRAGRGDRTGAHRTRRARKSMRTPARADSEAIPQKSREKSLKGPTRPDTEVDHLLKLKRILPHSLRIFRGSGRLLGRRPAHSRPRRLWILRKQ